jgi:hypothetical protein
VTAAGTPAAPAPVYALSADGMTLVIGCREAGGIRTLTVRRQAGAGPFTDEDVAAALSQFPGRQMLVGQRNTTRRFVTRFGAVWAHVMHGPPTWRRPRFERKEDGTLMAGWLRLAVAVKFETLPLRPDAVMMPPPPRSRDAAAAAPGPSDQAPTG